MHTCAPRQLETLPTRMEIWMKINSFLKISFSSIQSRTKLKIQSSRAKDQKLLQPVYTLLAVEVAVDMAVEMDSRVKARPTLLFHTPQIHPIKAEITIASLEPHMAVDVAVEDLVAEL